jgi:hypothetical protein
MMRELVRAAIIGDSVLNGLGITGANSFAVDVDTPPTRPFLQLRWGRNDVGLDVVTRRNLVVWVHDQPGDYTIHIDPIIYRLRPLLAGLEGQSNGLGHLIAAEWTGDSEDLTDDGHKTITRNVSFSLDGSGQ